MKLFKIFILSILCSAPSLAQEVVYDKVENRRLAIYLPEGYNESTENYKVAYFYDGQASFTNNPYSWKIHDKITELINNGRIEKIVGVGIYTDVNRTDDLVPYYDPAVAESFGTYKARGNKFDDTIVETIIPYIEENYKVIPDANSRALIGMSFGGLHALYTGINHPNTFSLVAGISASLWVSNYRFIKDAKKADVGPSIWFDIGTAEWNHYIGTIDALTNAGYTYGENLFYFEEDGASHNPKFWIPRLEYPLLLFAGETNPEIDSIDVITEVIPSTSGDKHFLRLNPIVNRADGLKYSLASKATYELLDSESGEIRYEGSFMIKQNYDMKVRISYKDWSEEITIVNEEIRKRMKN